MALTWSLPPTHVTPHITKIKAIHINEIRDYLDGHFNAAPTWNAALNAGLGGYENQDMTHPMASPTTAGFLSIADYNTIRAFVQSGNGVMGLAVTAPITDTGTASNPIIGIVPSSRTVPGSMSAAHYAKLEDLPDAATISGMVSSGTVKEVKKCPDTPAVTIKGSATIFPEISIALATPTQAGLLSAADKSAIDNMGGSIAAALPIGTTILWQDVGVAGARYADLFDAGGEGMGVFDGWKVMTSMFNKFPTGAVNGDAWQQDGSSTYFVGSDELSGNSSITLTSDQLPSHSHKFYTDDQLGIVNGNILGTAPTGCANDVSTGRWCATAEHETRDNPIHIMPEFIRFYFVYKYR